MIDELLYAFPEFVPPTSAPLFVWDLATHAPWFSHVPFALRMHTPHLPAALASVPFGFVLVRVRVRMIKKNYFAPLGTGLMNSPTHKQTEGRAPVWGSEFTSKRRRTTGGIQQKPLLG